VPVIAQLLSPLTYLVLRCPYCKTLNYAVEYRGVKTMEEKGVEQLVSAHTNRSFVSELSALAYSRQFFGIGNFG
jgi:phage FluMu protein Com